MADFAKQISFDGGQLRLEGQYQFTNSEIKFRANATFIGLKRGEPAQKSGHLILEWIGSNGEYIDTTLEYKKKYEARIPKKDAFTNWKSIKRGSTTVRARTQGKTVAVTLTSNLKPVNPSIAASYVNDNRANIRVVGATQKGQVNVQTVTLQRQDLIDSATWENMTTWTINAQGFDKTFVDQTIERGKRYRYRAWSHNANGNSGAVNTGWMYTLPPDISNVGHTRNSNTTCTVTWERDGQYVDRSLITGFAIERSESNGAWTQIAKVGPGAVNVRTRSYRDTKCKANNWYKYRVKPINSRGTSKIAFDTAGTDPTYNTPSAPSDVKVVYTSANNGQLTFKNGAKTATELYIQRTDNGGSTWQDIATVDETGGVVKSYLDTSGITGESVRYRLRNARDEMATSEKYSAWAYSNTISTLKQPSAPTLTIPVNKTPVNLDNGFVTLSWVHNPNDGTPQEAAQIQYAINGTYVATITLGAVASYDLTLDPSRFSANDQVTWRVRTKGAHSSYSPWSAYNNFKILTSPEITFTAPDNGSTIENLPIPLSWSYSDDSGTLASLTLTIAQGVKTLKTISIPVGSGTSGTYTYSLRDFLFNNNEQYDLQVVATSSTGLSATDTISVDIDYVYVVFTNALFIDSDFDEETGQATLTLNMNEAEVDPEQGVIVDSPVVSAYLYRNSNGDKVLVGSDLTEGTQIVDYYAPINVPVTYELLQIAETGEISVTTQDFTFESDYWYVYWGTNNENMARAIWDPSGDVSLSRPEKEQIRYSGRKYPVTYDSTAIEETFGFSGVTDDREELNNFIQMMRDGGTGIWKSADGHCYDADFELSYSSDYTQNHLRWNISLDVTRIDNE